MSVSILNKSYNKYSKQWSLMRDVIEGDTQVKAAKEKYVPSLSGQDDKQYLAYLNRAVFEGYSQRVSDGLTGLLFAKAPKVEVPKKVENRFTNFDLKGSTLTDVVQNISSEVVELGRVGVLVDMGREETIKRPYASVYPTETIINWRHQNINNQNVLTMVVLQESESKWITDFDEEQIVIYRVLFLKDGIYEQHIYRPTQNEKGQDNGYSIEIITPLMNGKPLTYIPFVSITPEKLTIEPCKPPLLDLARVNIAHFKLNVDYYHGMHFTALPTPYGSGIQAKEGTSFHIGSTNFTWYSNPQAKLAFLEFGGKGLETLENEKTKLIESMVILGSNMLQGDKKVAEATQTVAMRSAGQNAILISMAGTISRGITKVLQIMTEWSLLNDTVSYSLNTDYNLTEISPQMVKEMITGRTLGEIPRKVLFDTLKKGEMLTDEITFDEFETMLSDEAPIVNTSALPSGK